MTATLILYILIGACVWFFIDFCEGITNESRNIYYFLIMLFLWPVVLLIALHNTLKEINKHE